ncbi:MAG: hypothetical protein IKQ91_01085 [Oscillospiraceae bacterium]|nr:hypothetical protein [Oscillospiraceae bacterium]
MSSQKQKAHTKKYAEQQMRRAIESAKKAIARRAARKKQLALRKTAYIAAAAVLVLLSAVWVIRNHTPAALHHKVIAESDHYEVTAAMFACYFRQCADNYLHTAEGSPDLPVYDPQISLKDQEYSRGVTWYDYFTDRTMRSVKSNLQLCEAAYKADFSLSKQQRARCKAIAAQEDLSRYQKGVRLRDLEAATCLTLLAQEYQNAVRDQITITDDEVSTYYQAHQSELLTASVLSYSFPWDPETTLAGDTTEYDAAVNAANKLAACKTQQEFTDFVFRYLTETKGISRTDAEQLAGELTVTKFVRDFPSDVQAWLRGDAVRGSTMLLPKNDQYCISVYFLREEPQADHARTVDFRLIALSGSQNASESRTARKRAAELRDEISAEAPDAQSQAFADRAFEFSEDAESYTNGGLISGYSSVRTAYGAEAAAWLFDRERQHGDMTIAEHNGTVLLLFFEGSNEKTGWENQVCEDIFSSKVREFAESCTKHEIAVNEKNYRYIAA